MKIFSVLQLVLQYMMNYSPVIRDDAWRKHIQCTHKFSSTHTGEEFIIYCKTENIIYLLECAICDLQYIGETKQQFSKRLSGHRSDANCKHDLPLSRHLRSTGHHDSFDKLNVTIIDHNPKWDDKSRQERESFWSRKLKTYHRMESMRKSNILSWLLFLLVSSSRIRT